VVPSAQGGIVIFDDATPRQIAASGARDTYGSLQWASDATGLYAANNETTGFDFYSLTVDASGVSLADDYGGIVLDPVTGQPVGSFASSGWMVPDSSVGRVFFLTTPATGAVSDLIQVFDINRFTLIASIPLQGIKGTPLQFIRWGARGLAFCTDAGYVYLVTGGFVDGSG
jgi:hypothetical protein